MKELVELLSSYSLLEIAAILLLSYAGFKWISEQVKLWKDKYQEQKTKYHEAEKAKEQAEQDLESRLQGIESKLSTDYERIQKAESHLYTIESSIKEVTKIVTEMRIQSLRKQILDFTNKAVNVTDVNVSREAYAEIDRVYVEYEALLKTCGKENGLVDYSYRCIKHSQESREKNKLFLEDFYIAPTDAVTRIRGNIDDPM